MSPYNVVDVYDEVYNSTKTILKRNQRHLYDHMLTLLSKTTTATIDCSNSCFPTEKYVQFWYTEILPLVFDEDLSIQTSAISAIQIAINNLDIDAFQKHSEWPVIKSTIVENYSKKIHNMREALNSNWYKIWCIIIRILNAEILRNAKIINTFLTIVELAFRSLDYNVRAEAFICWQSLAEIFFINNEICSQKRIKLLCIPLKSSQSKSVEAAVNKLKVWWYLICKIQKQVDFNIEMLFDSFIKFCFGGVNNNVASSAKAYNEIKEMATMCFLSMLGSSNKEIQNKMVSFELEPLPNGIINEKIMKKSWKLIIHASFEIIRLYADDENIIKLLWENLQPHFFKLGTVQLYKIVCNNLQELSKEQPQIVSYIIKELGSNKNFPYEMDDENNDYSSQNVSNMIIMYLDLIISLSDLNENNLMSLVEISFDLKIVYLSKNFRKVISQVVQKIMENKSDDDLHKFKNKVVVWTILSKNFIRHQNCSIESLTTDELNTLFLWVIWPLETFTFYDEKLDTNCFGDAFCSTWGNVLSFATKATIKLTFTSNLNKALKELAGSKTPIRNYSKLLTHLLNTTDVNFDINSKPQETLSLISYTISFPPFDNFSNDQIVKDLQKFLGEISEQKLEIIFDEVVEIAKNLVVAAKSKYISAKTIETFKIYLVNKVKKIENNNLLKQIKKAFSRDDDFVIIPSEWSLKPDRLTEHQKEKMKTKRNDIPALYNDMSQSQDSSSIKPWTPKKIILPKEEDEISKTVGILEASNTVDVSDSPTNSYALDNESNHIRKKNSRLEFTKENEDKKKQLMLREVRSLKSNTVAGLPVFENTLRKKNSSDDKHKLSAHDHKNTSINKEKHRINRKAKRRMKQSKQNDIEEVKNDNLSETLFTHRHIKLEITKNASVGKNKKEDVSTDSKLNDLVQTEVVAKEFQSAPFETSSTQKINDHINTETISEINEIPFCEIETNQILNIAKIDEPPVPSSNSSVNKPINCNTSPINDTPLVPKETEESSKESTLLKRKNTMALLSSPERKTIICSTSPVLKPKMSSNLFGRGAQLINMIRNKNANNISKNNRLDNKTDELTVEQTLSANISQTTHNDILIFSKVLPASDASPSSSILKRKFRESNDNNTELPAHKRKRVSFHDPPVSLTKEYIKHDETDELNQSKAKINLSRRLSATTDSPKRFSLKRKNRVDSIFEISNYSEACTDKPGMSSTILDSLITSSASVIETPSTSNSQNANNNLETFTQIVAGNDEDGLLNLITEKYSMEKLLKNSITKDSAKSLSAITNAILSIVKSDSKIQYQVLEKLSETYPIECLNHAIIENSSSTVCNHLTIESIIEFIFGKSKQDISTRKQILTKTQALLKDEKFSEDSNGQLLYLLQNNKMTNEEILKYIEILASKRQPEKS